LVQSTCRPCRFVRNSKIGLTAELGINICRNKYSTQLRSGISFTGWLWLTGALLKSLIASLVSEREYPCVKLTGEASFLNTR
jgi:hypothetical protein